MVNKFEPTGNRFWDLASDEKDYSSYEEFYDMLKQSIECMDEADDCGTVDFMMAGWQERISKWKPILDEHGGI